QLHSLSFPTRSSSDLKVHKAKIVRRNGIPQPTPVCGQPLSRYPRADWEAVDLPITCRKCQNLAGRPEGPARKKPEAAEAQLPLRSEEHTSELQSRENL